MTPEEFEAKVGHKPEQDDLERANCELAGNIGHSMCGWCLNHDKPRFICGCLVKEDIARLKAGRKAWDRAVAKINLKINKKR